MGAYSSFEEDREGFIKKWQLADLVLFSQALFSIDPMKIPETQLEMTVVVGKKIFKRK